ncbi:ATP-dependent protease subunit HslV [Natranaerofaba carboxydovora]|uniref:ATP-dependent protease subunit HslV n=1 Tax=Natranaerofaba carboxydovora TaxID=2742683 RepID=UPI001F131915|nr:ATP-dependent protease subunit HslV [Natranaerofaba carboxydovora]UMZ73350.1 ATP-dependent protease subunit ClpQ [Natranaerofaba carboxydovora]
MEELHGTTIVGVKNSEGCALAGDGQVTLGNNTIFKHGAVKIRKLYNNNIIAGFAGSVADAMTLFEKFEAKLEKQKGNMVKAAVELAKEWRSDKILRRLEALLLVANKEHLLIISGTGEVIEPDDEVGAIGSGGPYALGAARMLKKHTDLSAREVAYEALKSASEICVYTNDNITVEELKGEK